MKKLLSLLLMMLVCTAVPAQAANTASLKVGIVDFQKALNEVKQGKEAKDALKKDFDTKQKKLDLQQSELMKMKEDFEKSRLALSDDALKAKEKDLNDRFQQLQTNLSEFRRSLNEKEGKMMTVILGNLKVIVSEIGQKDKFDLIVEKSQGSVVYAASQEDLTARVVGIYDKRYSGKININ